MQGKNERRKDMLKKSRKFAWLLSFLILVLGVAPMTFAQEEVLEVQQAVAQTVQQATVDFKVTSDWGTGFSYTIDIKNTGTEVIKDWQLTFDYTGSLTSVWDGLLKSDGNSYTITNAGWNKDIEPGKSISLGGSGTKSGVISNMKLNGMDISGGDTPVEEIVAPTGLIAKPQGQNVIVISWDNVSGVSEYELLVDGTTVKVNTNTYTHENLVADTTHTYKVRVAPTKETAKYLWSSEISAKTEAAPVGETVLAPTGLKAVANGQNEIVVSWDEVTDVKNYELMVDGVVVTVGGKTYTHTGLKAGSSHKYKVRVAPVKEDVTYLWSSEVTAKTESEPVVPGQVGEKLLIGYWHNFDNGSTNIRLRDIPAEWDVVQVAFGETSKDRAVVEFEPYNCTEEEFKADIKYLNSKGVRVIFSLGGQNGVLHIDSPADVEKFVNSVSGLIDKYGFNGLDVDVENGITVVEGDKNLKNPVTPRIKYMVEGINKICDKYGDDFWLTMAPEIAYVQGGITAFGGPWGGYLPIIEGVRHNLTMIHVQHYNCGGNAGLDGKNYTAGTADFQVAMAEMLLKGFNIGNDPNAFFEPLRPDQVGIGIPAKPQAAPSGGYIAPAEMKKALDYLIFGKSYGGQYTLQNPEGYQQFRGVMTWSINWDNTQNNSFAKDYRAYFDSIGGQRLQPIK